MTSRRTVPISIGGAILIFLVALVTLAASGQGRRPLTIEVAEDPSRFVFAGDHVIPDGDLAGFPDYGDYFVTQGWIYPKGTLGDSDGVICEFDADGIPTSCEPEFPDRVIGEWTCYGVHIGEGAATETGPWVVTTQIFDLGDSDVAGDVTVVTDGFELPEVGVPVTRAITGGSGEFSRARGSHEQTFLGFGTLFNVRSSNVIDLD